MRRPPAVKLALRASKHEDRHYKHLVSQNNYSADAISNKDVKDAQLSIETACKRKWSEVAMYDEEEEEEEDEDGDEECSSCSSYSGFVLPVSNRYAILSDHG